MSIVEFSVTAALLRSALWQGLISQEEYEIAISLAENEADAHSAKGGSANGH